MHSRGALQWKCQRCKLKLRKHVVGAVVVAGKLAKGRKPTRALKADRPAATRRTCRRCFRPMFKSGITRHGSQGFQCRGCPYSPTKLRDGATLLAFASSRIPSHLPGFVREDAAAALAADILAKKRSPLFITPAVVRRYVRAAFGFNDPKKFSFLDAPTRGGSPFGAMLEG